MLKIVCNDWYARDSCKEAVKKNQMEYLVNNTIVSQEWVNINEGFATSVVDMTLQFFPYFLIPIILLIFIWNLKSIMFDR